MAHLGCVSVQHALKFTALALCLFLEHPAHAADGAIAPIKVVERAYELQKRSIDALSEQGPKDKFASKAEAEYQAVLELMTPRLRGLWMKDREYTVTTGMAGHVDSDPMLCGQDFEAKLFKSLKLAQFRKKGGIAKVQATLENFGNHRVVFTLLLQDGRWLIDEIVSDGVSVSALLAQPYDPAGAGPEGEPETQGPPR